MNLLGIIAKLGSLTMLSRVLGFVRDAVLARVFGAGMAMDAFVVAFRLPNLLRRIFAEGAFSQAFVPILAEYKEGRTTEETREFVCRVAGMLLLVLCLVTAAGVAAAPWVVKATAGGWREDDGRFALAVLMLPVVFPYILWISLSSFVGSILNTYGRFSVPAFTPVLLNLSFILFALVLLPYFDPPVMALAWAVFAGGVAQLAFQLPLLRRLGFLRLPRLRWGDAAVGRVVRQMLPAVVGSSVAQISLIINTNFASYLPAGSVSWLYFADRLMELPTGVLGVALGTVLLPGLSKHAANTDAEAYSALLDWGLRLCLLLAAPAAVGLAVLAFPLVATLFLYGGITVHDAHMTEQALTAYAAGLVGLIVIKVLAPGFYARKDIRTPVRVAVFTLVCTQLMNLAFIGSLRHTGLALAVGLGACLNALLLYVLLRRKGFYRPRPGWFGFLCRLACALAVMGGGLWLLEAWWPLDWAAAGGLIRALRLGLAVAAGMVLYFGALGLLGFRPRDFRRREAV